MTDTQPTAQETTPPAPTPSPEPSHVVGIDLGANTAVVALTSLKSLRPDLLRNDLSNQQTPHVVCLHGKERSFGELATQKLTSKIHLRNAVNGRAVFQALEQPNGAALSTGAVGRLAPSGNEDPDAFVAEYDDTELNLLPEQVLGMFLGKLQSYVDASIRSDPSANKDAQVPAAVVVPDTFGSSQCEAVRRACVIAGVNLDKLVTRRTAAAMAYGSKKSPEILTTSKRVMIVDIGAMYCTVSVHEWGKDAPTADVEEGEEVVDAPGERIDPKHGRCLAYETSALLGSGQVDAALFDALSKQCETKYKFSVSADTKAGVRLLIQVVKLKKSLSGVGEANCFCEGVGPDGEDAQLRFSRAELEVACEKYSEDLGALVERVAKAAGCKDIPGGVELIGGGTYIPWVQTKIQSAVQSALECENIAVGFTLDSMASPAVGASMCVAQSYEPVGAVVRPVFETLAKLTLEEEEQKMSSGNGSIDEDMSLEDELNKLKLLELQMRENDAAVAAMHTARNKLEAFVFEHKSIVSGGRDKHSELIDKPTCEKLLDAVEEWMWDEGETGTAQMYVDKLAEVEQGLNAPMLEFRAACTKDREEMESKLKQEAEIAEKERAANGEQDDHDFRKLSKPDRMKKVAMNKDEGNSLFKDGNYEPASLRYIRALQHTTKFFDLSPTDTKEVDVVILSLQLNLAQCFIKMEKWERVISHCGKALEVGAANPKALYRRALAFEKTRKFDEAKKDVVAAAAAAVSAGLPIDKAVARLTERIDAQLKRQSDKQKKMAQKMFG